MKNIYEWFGRLVGFPEVDTDTKVLFWFLVFVALLLLGLIIYLIYNFFDYMSSYDVTMDGVIIDKSHKEATSSTGVGFGPTTNGGVATVLVSSSSPEKWSFIVRENISKQVVKINGTMQQIYDTPIGSKITLSVMMGGLSKSVLEYKIESIEAARI